ncbi:unnamed protein product [Lymnaea stagnalis]|uniref:Hexosyltransferase n=1 Tax=Lymnaea stagnalis TaxID=6523 RepID=A0AAV2HYT4_LYMST
MIRGHAKSILPFPYFAVWNRVTEAYHGRAETMIKFKKQLSPWKEKSATVYLAVVSLCLNAVLLFLASDVITYGGFFADEGKRTLHQTKDMVADLVHGLDLSSFDTPKSSLFHTVLECVLDPIKNEPTVAEEENTNSSAPSLSILHLLSVPTLHKLNARLQSQAEAKSSVISFLLQPITNEHNFQYVHNPSHACAHGKTDVLFVVPSAPDNFDNRIKTRTGKKGEYVGHKGHNAKMVFFLGLPASEKGAKIQTLIDIEAGLYGDIVQETFEDVYANIRHKSVSMLKWASTFCQQATYVIRTDDDVMVDIPKVYAVMRRKHQQFTDFIVGDRKDNWEPVRETDSKYYLSEQEYAPSTLPPFALGGLLGFPISTVSLLYQAALRTKPIWLDDVYITGMCARNVDVPLLKDKDFKFKHREW